MREKGGRQAVPSRHRARPADNGRKSQGIRRRLPTVRPRDCRPLASIRVHEPTGYDTSAKGRPGVRIQRLLSATEVCLYN